MKLKSSLKRKNGNTKINTIKIMGSALFALSLLLNGMEQPLYVQAIPSTQEVQTLTEIHDIDYSESLEDISNPGRGFYKPVCIHYTISDNPVNLTVQNLLHMRLDLSEFSGGYNGVGDMELSQDMLDSLDQTLSNLEEHHGTAIIRFAYDPWYQGGTVIEPSIDMILHHQEQLGEVLSRHANSIVSVECGLFGKWGEMHSTDMCNAKNFNQAITQWLHVLPDSIPISVRTPEYYADWADVKLSTLSQNITTEGEDAYRVGIYNDGYLGSDSDLGTYANREEELKWLNLQAKHTLFGGEIVENTSNKTVKNTAEYMASEAFTTHTSYLNSEWNGAVLEAMKNETYHGPDPRYAGQTGYQYISNHLGYRFVTRGVRLTREVTSHENFEIEVDIENVGFANLVKSKQVELLFVNGEDIYRFDVNTNPTKWDSQTTTCIKETLDLPDDMPEGNYQIYLRVASDLQSSGQDGYPIRFANDNTWNTELGANYLGFFTLLQASTTDDQTDSSDESEDDSDSSSDTQSQYLSDSSSDTQSQDLSGSSSDSLSENDSDTASDVHSESNSDSSSDVRPEQVSEEISQNMDKVSPDATPIAGTENVRENTVEDHTDQITDIITKDGLSYRILSRDEKGKQGTVKLIGVATTKKTITIPNQIKQQGYRYNVTSIGKKAFAGKPVKKIKFGKYVTTIETKAFYNCRNLKNIYIGDKVTSIGAYAFANCKSLKTITIGKNVKKIGKKAFYAAGNCESLTIKSKKLTSNRIGKNAFGKMNKNVKIKVPK